MRRSGGHGGRGGSCTYDLAEVSESQLVVQAGDAGAYAARKESYAAQSGVPMEAIPLGKEAFLVNRAQVIVLDEDGQSLSLGLSIFTYDQPLPVEHEEIAAGLESLARTALDRM